MKRHHSNDSLLLRRLSARHISKNVDFASAHTSPKDEDAGTRPAVPVAETSHTRSFVKSLNLQEWSQSAVRHSWMHDIDCDAIPQADKADTLCQSTGI